MHDTTIATNAIWKAYQVSAKKIHYRQPHTADDKIIVAMYQALEKNASDFRALSLKFSLLEVQEPSAACHCEYADLLKRLS